MRQHVDAYTAAWQDAYTEACRATEVRREQSQALLDRRMSCLQRSRVGLDATLRLLEDADGPVVARIDTLMEGLPDLTRCTATRQMEEVEPPSSTEAMAVADARAAIADAAVQFAADRSEAAAHELDRAQASLVGIGYEPVRAELFRWRGKVAVRDEDLESANDFYRAAAEVAARNSHWVELGPELVRAGATG